MINGSMNTEVNITIYLIIKLGNEGIEFKNDNMIFWLTIYGHPAFWLVLAVINCFSFSAFKVHIAISYQSNLNILIYRLALTSLASCLHL
jgi:hypothetical protein